MVEAVVNQEILDKKKEFVTLGIALGVVPNNNAIKYTPELGQEVLSKLEDELSNLKIRTARGYKTPDNPEAILASRLSKSDVFKDSKANSKDIVELLEKSVRSAYSNVEFLNDPQVVAGVEQNTGQSKETLSKSPQVEVKTVTKLIPIDDKIKPDDRILRLEEALQDIVPQLNKLDKIRGYDVSPISRIEMPSTPDGFLDEKSLVSYKGVMQHLNFVSDTAAVISDEVGRKNKPDEFVSKNADDIEKLLVDNLTDSIAENAKKIEKLSNSVNPDQARIVHLSRENIALVEQKASIPRIMKDIAELDKEGLLNNPVKMHEVQVASDSVVDKAIKAASNFADAVIKPAGANADKPKTQKLTDEEAIAKAKVIGKEAGADKDLSDKENAAKNIERFLSEVGGSVDKMIPANLSGMIDAKALTSTVFDTSKVKVDGHLDANEQELTSTLIMGMKKLAGDKDPNGSYNEAVGNKLKLAVLTNPAFSFIRNKYNIGNYGDSKENVQLAKELLAFEGGKPELKDGASAEEKALHEKKLEFYNKHEKELASVSGVKTLFNSMDTLSKSGEYDNKKAQEKNQANMMMDLFAANADQYGGAGIKNWFQDFFQNSEFGQKIAKFLLSFLKIDVSRLWGEKANSAKVEQATKGVGDDLEAEFKAIEKANPNMSFADQMAKTREEFSDDHNGWGKQLAFKTFIGSDDTKLLNASVDEALKATEGSANISEAKAAFIAKATEIRNAYDSGEEFKIGDKTFKKDDVPNSIDQLVAQHKSSSPVAQPSNKSTATTTNDTDLSRKFSKAVEEKPIIAGDQNINLGYRRDVTNYEQDPMRFSKGRVGKIQEAIYSNYSDLELSSLIPDVMRGEEGRFTDTLTPETNAILEELLIRAQVHDFVNNDKTITQSDLDGFDRKLSPDNIGLIKKYMEDSGVPSNDISQFVENINALDADFRSTRPDSEQNISVWDQSHFGNQFNLSISQPELKADVTVETKLPQQEPIKEYEEPKHKFNRAATRKVPHTPPNSFVELRKLADQENQDLAKFVDDEFKNKDIDIWAVFENNLSNGAGVSKDTVSKYAILELKKFGIKNDDIDAVVALKHPGLPYPGIEYRYVDYDTDNIKSIDLQRAQGLEDMAMRGNSEDTRRLDDVLATIKNVSGGRIIQGPAGGYTSMIALVPDSINVVRAQNAMKGVYGDIAVDPRTSMQAVNIYAGNGKYPPPNEIHVARNDIYHNSTDSYRDRPVYRGGYNNRQEDTHVSGRVECGDGMREFGDNIPIVGFLTNGWRDIVGNVADNFDCGGSNNVEEQIRDTTGNDHTYNPDPDDTHEYYHTRGTNPYSDSSLRN